MKKHALIVASILIVLSSFVRLYKLSSIPEGFHSDEAAFGYNAYSLLKTGKDEYGKPFPLILASFGDYKGAVYSYTVMPFVAIMGLNELAVRLPTALSGILVVVVSLFLIHALTNNTTLSLVAATIVSFTPGSIVLSRVQSDPLMAVLFILFGWFCIHKYIESKRWRWAFGAFVFWWTSCFTYPSPRVLLFGFIPLLYWYYRPVLDKKARSVFLVAFLGIAVTVSVLMAGPLGSRFRQVNVFSSPEVLLPLEEQIREDGVGHVPIILTRLYHNKLVNYGRFIIRNCASYFGFDFLFFQSLQPEREKVPNIGFMHLIDLPFLLIGLYALIQSKKRWAHFILAWFVFTPCALSIFGQETPNIHRYYFSILPGSLIVAFGIATSVSWVKKQKTLVIGGIAAAYFLNVSYFFHELFLHQPLHSPRYRGFVYKRMVSRLEKIQHKYETIVITKAHQSPYIYMLFFMKYDPVKYQRIGSPRDLDYSGFDTFVFVPVDCPSEALHETMERENPGKRILYINKGGCPLSNDAAVLESIYWRDGGEAFQFVETIASESGGASKL